MIWNVDHEHFCTPVKTWDIEKRDVHGAKAGTQSCALKTFFLISKGGSPTHNDGHLCVQGGHLIGYVITWVQVQRTAGAAVR